MKEFDVFFVILVAFIIHCKTTVSKRNTFKIHPPPSQYKGRNWGPTFLNFHRENVLFRPLLRRYSELKTDVLSTACTQDALVSCCHIWNGFLCRC